jgi:hypothetical protein
MKYVLVSYNNDPTWIKEYTDDWVIYDRSEKPFDFPNTIHTENVGQVDYDKLGWLIENYNNLPDVFLWSKTNLFKFISEVEFEVVKNNKEFTPLLTRNHRTYMPACWYDEDGMYREINNSWYASQFTTKYFKTFKNWAKHFNILSPEYIPFAPGGSYILTKERVHRYPKEFYEEMRSYISYDREPAEAQFCERSYYLMWK